MAQDSLPAQRANALKTLHEKPAVGPAGIDAVFRYLWRTNPRDSATPPDFHIPHTISIKFHELDCWIYSGLHGDIKRKRKDQISISSLEEVFSSSVGASGIAAALIDPTSLNDLGFPATQYLSMPALQSLLRGGKLPNNGIIQQYIDPKGGHSSSIRVDFAPAVQKAVRATNTVAISDSSNDAAATFDDSTGSVKFTAVTNSQLYEEVTSSAQWVATHLQDVFAHTVKVTNFSAFFRQDPGNRLWLQIITNMAYEGPLPSTQMPAKVVPALFDTDALWDDEKAKLDKSLKRFSESKELQSSSVLRLLQKASVDTAAEAPAGDIVPATVSIEEEWLEELQARRPNMPIPRDVHGMIKLVANQCPSCGAKLRKHHGDTAAIPRVPKKTVLLHYQLLLSRLGLKPFDMSFAQEKQMEGNLTAVKKPTKHNMWPKELDAQIAADGVGLYGVYALSMEQKEQIAAMQSFGEGDAQLKLVVREVPPIINLLYPGVDGPELQGLRQDPTWLLEGVEVCSQCYESFAPILSKQMTAETRGVAAQQVLGPAASRPPLHRPKSLRIKEELQVRREKRGRRMEDVQQLQQRLRQHAANSQKLDGSETVHIGSLALPEKEAKLAAELFDKGKKGDDDTPFGGTAEATPIGFDYTPGAAAAPVPDPKARASDPLLHMLQGVEWATREEISARNEIKPSGEVVQADAKEMLGAAQERNRLLGDALPAQVKAFQKFEAAKKRAVEAWENGEEPSSADVQLLKLGPPPTPGLVAVDALQRSATAPLGMSRKQHANLAWQSRKRAAGHHMGDTVGQIERAKILARSIGGTTFAQPKGVVLSYGRPKTADAASRQFARPQFTNQVGPGATNLLNTWIAATDALGGPDKKLATIGSGKVSDPSLARVFGGTKKQVRRNPFLAASVVPSQGTHRSMSFTPVMRPQTTQSLQRTARTTRRLPSLPSAPTEAFPQEVYQSLPGTSPVALQPSETGLFPRASLPSRSPSGQQDETPNDQHVSGHNPVPLQPSETAKTVHSASERSPIHTSGRSSPSSPTAELGGTGRSLLPDLQAASHTANSITFKHFPSSRTTRELIISKHRATSAPVAKKAPPEQTAANPHELGELLADDFIAAGEQLSFRTNSIESAYSRLSAPEEKKKEKKAKKRLAREQARVTAAADAYIAAEKIRKKNAVELCESMLDAEVERQRRIAALQEQRQRRRREKEEAMRMSVSQGRPAADSRLKASSESKLALGGVEEAMLYSADALNIRVGEGFTRMPSRFAIEAEKRRRKREVEKQQREAKREGADTGEVILTEDEKMMAAVLGSSKLLKPSASTGILACKLQVAKLGEFKASSSKAAGKDSARVWLLVVRRAMIGEYQPTHEQAVIGMASLSTLRDFGAGQGGALGDDPELVRKAALELAGAQSKISKSKSKQKLFSVPKADVHNVEVMWGRGMYCLERLDVHSGAVTREYLSRHDLWQGAERDPLLLQAKRSELMWKSAVEGAGIDFLASQFCVRVLPPVSVSSSATELAVLPPHPVRLGSWKDMDEQNELARLRRGATSAFTHEGRKRVFDRRREVSLQRLQAMAASKDVEPALLQEELVCIKKTQLVKQLAGNSSDQKHQQAQPINARLARLFGTLHTARWVHENFPAPVATEEHPNIPRVDPALGPSCWPHISRARSAEEPAPSISMLSSFQGPGGAWPTDVAAALNKVCMVPNTVEGIVSGGLYFRRGGFHSVFLRGHSSAHPVESRPFTLFHYGFMTGKARCERLSFYDLITDEVVKEIPEVIRQARCFYANLVLSISNVLREDQLVSRPQTAPVFRIARLKEPSEDDDIETKNLKKHTDVAVVPSKFQRGSLASMVKMHGRSMMYYTLRANEQYPHTFSVRTHSIGERKNTSRDLAQQSVESPDRNPFISRFAKPLVTAFGLDVGRQILAARIRHIDDEPWLLALCVGPPQSSRTYGPMQARSELLSAHFKLSNPARASSPRGDRDGYDITETLQQKADMDDTLGTFYILTVRLVRQGDWTEHGHCVEFPDILPTEAHEGSDPESFGSIELSYGKAATATLNPLLEHAGNAPPPTAVKLEERHRKLEKDYYLQQGAVVNEEEFMKQAMDKAQMLASMEHVDIEKKFRDAARPDMIRAVDAAIGYAAGKITERPSIGLDSVFTQFSGDKAFEDASGGAMIK